mmetsp:Transcript_115248/g.229623  ORF Transcript_115248/g.229623 Transcript_115248/m.229623 type:complete len:138 (-) Transcript_115248:75-488(-)
MGNCSITGRRRPPEHGLSESPGTDIGQCQVRRQVPPLDLSKVKQAPGVYCGTDTSTSAVTSVPRAGIEGFINCGALPEECTRTCGRTCDAPYFLHGSASKRKMSGDDREFGDESTLSALTSGLTSPLTSPTLRHYAL